MTTIPLTEAKKRLTEIVRDAAEQGKVYSVTKRGKPTAIIMSEEDYRSIQATLEVLSDPEEYAGVMRGRADIEAGRVVDLENLLERLQG